MGASQFYRTSYGKDAQEAFNNASQDALYEKGHQGGYSGDLNSKDGFVLELPPAGVELSVWLNALSDLQLPESLQPHSREFERQFRIYDNKFGPALCFEASKTTGKSVDNKYIFLGWAPE
jgi:hypothetical protein